ncbi:unnamed protein product, partial [Mesorhabditis spiculigera]
MQGGNLDIISATEALSAWAVDDAVIVLFTGSDQNNINAAGRDYTRKEWTKCQVLLVADVTDAAPQSEAPTLMATMVDLYTGAGANGINVSMAFWSTVQPKR